MRTLILSLLLACGAFAQTQVDYPTQVKRKPITSGSVLPTSCAPVGTQPTTAGNLFFLSTTNTLYVCNGTTYEISSATLNVQGFGAKGDGVTNDAAAFQAAANAVNANGGGSILIPYSPACYIISAAVKIGSNTTVFSDARATCVKKAPGTQPACTDPGCNSVFYTDTTAPHSNIYFENFTIDGNKANITGVSLDGGNFGILLAGASNSGLQDMIVKNAYTGGVAVQCWGTSLSTLTNAGDGVDIINSVITASRRNNLENVCGRNTHMLGGELSYATGGSLSTGVDIEPNYTGTTTTGFSMTGVHVHHNRDGGILLQSNFEVAPTYSFTNNNVHDNGAMYGGARLINFNSVAADRGTVSVMGGIYANNGGGPAAISVTSWNTFKLGGGVTTLGSQRGVLIGSNVTESTLGLSNLSGTVYDLSVDGPNSHATMVGAYLAHGIIQPADIANVTFQLSQSGATGIITGSGVLNVPYTFQSVSTSAPIAVFKNTNAGGGVGIDGTMFANDLGNGWALKSLGSTYSRAGCLEAYNGAYIGLSLCPDGTLDIGKNNVGVGPTHTVDIRDGTASTGVTQVFIRDGAGQGTTPALTANRVAFGNTTVTTLSGSTAYFNATTSSFPTQGTYLLWNYLGQGETDFVNHQGSGTGGFNWCNGSGGAPSCVARLSAAGALTLNSGITTTGPYVTTTGVNNDDFGVLNFTGTVNSNTYTMAGTYTAVFCQGTPNVSTDLGSIAVSTSLVGGHWQIFLAISNTGHTSSANYFCNHVQ